jgi:hypothetical protein
MSDTKPRSSLGGLGDGLEDYLPDPEFRAMDEGIEARLKAGFDQHRADLLGHLQKVCERPPKTRSFDPDKSWRNLRHMAWCYLLNEARVEEEKRMMVPAADRVELLCQLRNALREARCKLDDARNHAIRGVLFVEWCEAHGNPDFTDPIMVLYETKFDKIVADVAAGLADLETAASRAAEYVRRKPGRPGGTGALQHDFIIDLEATYQGITGKRGGAGPGPFAQLVTKFLQALERPNAEQSVIDAIKAAKKREGKWWGQPFFADLGGQTPPGSP